MASQSMADYLKTTGWLVIIGWLLLPIISLLVNKLVAYFFSDVSRKFRNLETITVPDLKQTLRNVQELRMQTALEDKGFRSDVETLAKLEEDLKSAWDEAEYIIMDIVDYHRAEEEAVGHASSWVQQRLAAAGACIALCFRRTWFWLGRWIRTALLQFSVKPQVPSPDSPPTAFEATAGAAGDLGAPKPPLQLWGHISCWVWHRLVAAGTSIACCFMKIWSCLWRCINGVRTNNLVLWAQNLFWQHLGNFRGATPRTGGELLPISVETSVFKPKGSMVGLRTLSSTSPTASEATTTDANMVVDEKGHEKVEEIGEEKVVVEEEKVKEWEEQEKVEDERHEKVEEIEEEKVVVVEEEVKGVEEQEKVEEEIEEVEEEKEKVEEKKEQEKLEEIQEVEEQKEKVKEEIEERVDEEKVQEEEKKEENRDLYRRVQQYFQAMLIYLTKAISFARSYRDWSYEVVGIESNQRGGIAAYSLFPAFGTNSLGKRIKHIENVLDVSKKSHLWSQKSSSSEIPNKDTNNERSSSEIPVKEDSKKESSSSSSSRQEQIDHCYRKIVQQVFGRDKMLEDICGMFRTRSDAYGTTSSSSSKPYSVFGIHGITGSGKTTLANLICEHEKMSKDKHFDVIIFSHVSVTFRVEKIFGDILKEITGVQLGNEDIESLRNELKEKMKGRRFLLVLDDLWVKCENQRERGILHNALCDGKNGSIILVTAQRKEAAAALGAQEKDQMLIPDLEEEEYLSLFMHHALQGAVDHDGKFERTGRIIAEKLHRSPIAAVSVGRRLQAESISFWEITANLDMLNETMGALWWSYQQLCADTRRCFQFCSTFPRGHILCREELVGIWIALGFVNNGSNATEKLEDVGQCYLQELVKFSFLQVENYNSGIYTIHDLLHELAERVAGSDFLRIDGLNVLPAKDIKPGVRHLFVRSKNAAQGALTAEKNLDLGNLRTLIIYDEYPYPGMPDRKERRHDMEKLMERLFMSLRKLRVLIISLGSNQGKLSFLASIGQMKHLRYFSFHFPIDYRAKLMYLPSTFSKLYQLQNIILPVHGTVMYPDGMANLIRLRYYSGSHGVPNIGRMTSLQWIGSFHVKKEQGYELTQLKHLNKLRGPLSIDGLENVGSKEEALEAHLANKKRVTDLLLNFYGWTKNPDIDEAEVLEGLCPPKELQELTIKGYRGSRYPSWMLSGRQHLDAPRHLRRLSLIHCGSPLASFPEDSELFMRLHELFIRGWEQDSLPENMERLVSLQSLSIFGCQHSNSPMVLGPTLPRSLRSICISDSNLVLENLEHLVSLEDLGISSCDKMEVLPTLPQSLKKISISWCNVLSRTCQEEGHENWQKIQHIGWRAISYGGKTTIYNSDQQSSD